MKPQNMIQTQTKAIADILVLAIYADGHLSLLEDEHLKTKIDNLGWHESMAPSYYLNLSIPKAREANTREKVTAFLEARANLLENRDQKAEVYRNTVDLLKSDGLTEEESEFAGLLKSTLDL
ncbi:MAG: hypothetical protein AAF558_02110 [Verrucomicrobiota bacterium]